MILLTNDNIRIYHSTKKVPLLTASVAHLSLAGDLTNLIFSLRISRGETFAPSNIVIPIGQMHFERMLSHPLTPDEIFRLHAEAQERSIAPQQRILEFFLEEATPQVSLSLRKYEKDYLGKISLDMRYNIRSKVMANFLRRDNVLISRADLSSHVSLSPT